MTIFWHVENMKVSHVDPKDVTKFMECLEGIYGDLSIKRGKIHKYLGMTLYFQAPGELRVIMVDYLKGVLQYLPEVTAGRRTSPEANQRFQVRPEDERKLLDKNWATELQHTVAQLLFFASRYRKDTKTAIGFLCTQVRIPDEEWCCCLWVLVCWKCFC